MVLVNRSETEFASLRLTDWKQLFNLRFASESIKMLSLKINDQNDEENQRSDKGSSICYHEWPWITTNDHG